jgi:U3 small nucleolar RNA-associated protein 10
LGSEHYEVRKATLTIFAQSQVSVGDLNELGPLFAFFSGQRGQSCVSSILVDGAKALPQVFRQAMAASSEPKQLRRTILDGCVVSTKSEWLPGAIGSLHAVSVVLTTVELAGEASFPLLDRWTWAGMPILDLIRNDHRLHNADIIETVVRMLKGALVHDSRDLLNMVISQQGRTRSYSVGTNRGLGYIDPFPDEMAKAIVDCLCLKEEQKQTNIGIVRILIREVLCSESWCAAIFKELSPRHRIAIASKLLQMLSTDIMDEANKALLHLPLFGSDLDKLLKDHSADLVALSSLIDHIQSNAPSISSSGDLVKVTASLFSALNIVSSSDYLEDDGGGLEFLRHSMLQALLSLSSCSADAVFVSEELLPGTVNLLVALVGGGDVRSSGDRPLGSWRARKTALSLLTSMGSQKPSSVMKRLLTALVSCINNRVSSREAILSVVPIIHKFSDEANLSLVDIFDPIIKATRQVLDPFLRIELHQGMVFALATTNDEKALGVFLSLLNFERTRPSTDVVLLDLEPTMILRCILVLISFMSQVFDYLTSSERVGDRSLALILDGLDVDNDYERARACVFCQKMGDLIAEILSIKRVEAHLQNSSDSSLVLQLWQSLLILHAEVEDFESTFRDSDYVDEKTRRFMDLCRSCIGQVVDSVHHLLPVPVFLASVSSLIDDKDVGDVRVKALRHLADSASTVECDDPEAALFLELLPSVTAMIREADQDAILLQQGAILVIEQFARSLFSPELELSKDLDGSFMEALQCLVARLIANSKLLESVPVCNRAVIFQLVSSVGLGIATLVQALKTRALPLLATLIEAVLSCLSLVHTVQSSQSTLEPHVQLLRLSMTRALTAIVQCLSQFLIPYLDKILLPSVLTTLRFDGSDFVPIVAESVPPRQLIPAASRALKNCTSIDQFKMVLEVTKLSVLRASQAEISPVKASILLIVLMSCEFEDSMMDLINEVMVAFVMKLSEPQLREVYAKIRDWRDEAGGSRTFAFWSISAALSRELKSFFLPCVSAVAVDASRDVERAASILSPSNSNSKKRIKVGSVDSLNFLPALVSCLGHAFSADAREGGKWIREDEDKRYYAFMEPLSKLLQARVPSDFPVGTPTKNPYHALIVQDGGVVSCLVSLASAAGNETLWKPLNHAVIEACNNEDHIEIQRAGLTCLLKLIQTLGEEYMILLPECLPVLSELLEADEETAAIARGCVELSEELLGESLEESLR